MKNASEPNEPVYARSVAAVFIAVDGERAAFFAMLGQRLFFDT